MNRKLIISIAFIALILNGLTSCTTCSRKNEGFVIPDELFTDGSALQVNPSVIEDMVDNISSPIEMASLMRALNVPFSQRYLAPTRNLSQFNTSHEKAFKMGVLGCDLGYLNMYGRTSLVLDYIQAMKSLADDINVGQFFDFNTLRRIATNNQNIDSLVFISQQSFTKMERHLQQNNRGNLSMLMVAGVWLEGLYLSCQFLRERPHERRLAESIAEQKIILDQLLILLRNFSNERYIADVVAELSTIKELFDDIRITYEIGEPVAVEENGMLTIKQTDISIVHYTDELMQAIIDQAENVRNKLIKNNV